MTHVDTRVRLCCDCDGFPVVHIDSGTTQPDGTRRTLPVICRTCGGTGLTTIRPFVASVGR